jgi:hypothetical protein
MLATLQYSLSQLGFAVAEKIPVLAHVRQAKTLTAVYDAVAM